MVRFAFAVLSFGLLAIVSAQTPVRRSGEPSSVDDADTTARGAYSGELSYLAPLHGSPSGDSPFGLVLAYGLGSRTEVGLDVGALSGEPRYRRGERDDFGDLALTLKNRFFTSGEFALAAAAQTTLLLADRARGDDLVDPSLYLVASQGLGKLQVVGNLGATAPGGSSGRTVPLLGASATYDLHRATDLVVQANENPPRPALVRNRLELAAGITHGFGAGFEVQALVGRSGRGERNDGVFLGASYRFGGGR